jgi:hypothetical protein
VVGYIGHDKGFGWELAAVFGTALGTTLLAAATGLLALLTWRDVSAAQELARLTSEEAERTREGLDLAREQGETARKALDAQTQPFLTVGSRKPDLWSLRSGHVRNAGAGTAIVGRVEFLYGDATVLGTAVDPAVPPGETTAVRAASGPAGDPATFSIAVAFDDPTGRPRGAVRLDVNVANPQDLLRSDVYAQPPRYVVRQVFWADDIEQVKNNPQFGTQPLD